MRPPTVRHGSTCVTCRPEGEGSARAVWISEEKTFATTSEPARARVRHALASALPTAWVTADAAYGQERRFRRVLEEAGVGYVLAVPRLHVHPRLRRTGPAGDGACLSEPAGCRPGGRRHVRRSDHDNTRRSHLDVAAYVLHAPPPAEEGASENRLAGCTPESTRRSEVPLPERPEGLLDAERMPNHSRAAVRRAWG
ncbi:transposase [Streptomyces litmocidini]|uniref:transposase n=1 Tax=Streptomyces litmocidini TaxID=67318 RepID=UPI0037022185